MRVMIQITIQGQVEVDDSNPTHAVVNVISANSQAQVGVIKMEDPKFRPTPEETRDYGLIARAYVLDRIHSDAMKTLYELGDPSDGVPSPDIHAEVNDVVNKLLGKKR